MKRIAVFASGGGTNFQAVVDGCKAGKIKGEVKLLIYNRKDAYVKERADNEGIDSVYINKLQFESEKEKAQRILSVLGEYDIDIVVLAGYLDILHENVVAQYKNKIINTHPALIPSFCGMGMYGIKVHQAVLDYGAKVSGCTIHFVTENADEGPIIMQKAVEVNDDDTAETLASRILPIEHELLVRCVGLMCEDRIKVEGRKVTII